MVSRNQFQEGIEQLREAQRLRPDDPKIAELIQQAEAARKRTSGQAGK